MTRNQGSYPPTPHPHDNYLFPQLPSRSPSDLRFLPFPGDKAPFSVEYEGATAELDSRYKPGGNGVAVQSRLALAVPTVSAAVRVAIFPDA